MKSRPATEFARIVLLCLGCCLLLGVGGANGGEEEGLTPCTLMPLWSPQAQFAGYYVAQDKGFYRKHGLDMVILKGGPACSGCEYLKDGRADFAVLWLTTAIRQYGEGLRLVHVGQMVPRSSMMLVARKSRDIREPADLKGAKVGVWGGDLALPPRAFFRKFGLEVKEVPQSYTVNLFLRGGVDAASAMWYNEYHTILNSGIDPDELTVFPMWEYGLNFPEDGLYMMEAAYRKNPSLAAACVQASLEGWAYAFDHPEEALDIVMQYMQAAKISANRTHQRWMLARMRDLIMPAMKTGDHRPLNRTDFTSVSTFLLQSGLIREAPDFDAFTGGPRVAP
ncbi:MAG: ABC transporter substrate-binding protein [Thermodesulfobacteriota bacterium]